VSTGPRFEPPAGRIRETNGLAIAALVTGIVALVPVAVVLGIVALVQIKRRGDRGRGLAIGGLAAAGAWVLVAVVAITFVATNLVGRDALGRIDEAGYVNEIDLYPGDCLEDATPTEDAVVLSAVPCDEQHRSEVVGRFTLKGGGHPGAGSVRRRARAGCRHRLEDYAPRAPGALVAGMTYFSPDRVDWAIGDHDVTCFANFDGKRRGSLNGLQDALDLLIEP
jgi:hypothetical protein